MTFLCSIKTVTKHRPLSSPVFCFTNCHLVKYNKQQGEYVMLSEIKAKEKLRALSFCKVTVHLSPTLLAFGNRSQEIFEAGAIIAGVTKSETAHGFPFVVNLIVPPQKSPWFPTEKCLFPT